MYYESKMKYEYQYFKNVNLPFLQGIRLNIFPFAPTFTKVIQRSSDLSATFREIILEGNLYLGPLEIILRTLASGMTYRLPVITCPAEGYN